MLENVRTMAEYKSRLRLTSRCVKPLFLLLRTSMFLVLISVISVCSGYVEQKFAMEPQDQVILNDFNIRIQPNSNV